MLKARGEAVRIISGYLKGRRFDAPKGKNTRPSTDRSREAIISSLYSQALAHEIELEDSLVLDLFAGSGALSFELVSRGASRALLNDKDRQAQLCLKKNIQSLGIDAHCKLSSYDLYKPHMRQAVSNLVIKELQRSKLSCVLLDPPYAYPAQDVLEILTDIFFELSVRLDMLQDDISQDDMGQDDVGQDDKNCADKIAHNITEGFTFLLLYEHDKKSDSFDEQKIKLKQPYVLDLSLVNKKLQSETCLSFYLASFRPES